MQKILDKKILKAYEGSALGWIAEKIAGKKGKKWGDDMDTYATYIPGVGQVTAALNIGKNAFGLARDVATGKATLRNASGRLVNLGADSLAFIPGAGGLVRGVAKAGVKSLARGVGKNVAKRAIKLTIKKSTGHSNLLKAAVYSPIKDVKNAGKFLGMLGKGLVKKGTWELAKTGLNRGIALPWIRELIAKNNSYDAARLMAVETPGVFLSLPELFIGLKTKLGDFGSKVENFLDPYAKFMMTNRGYKNYVAERKEREQGRLELDPRYLEELLRKEEELMNNKLLLMYTAVMQKQAASPEMIYNIPEVS